MASLIYADIPPAGPDAFRKIKRLEEETYVTNKASATPLRNYAPQSRLKCSISLILAGEVLIQPSTSGSTLRLRCPRRLKRSPAVQANPSISLSDGILS